jgi:hypothetical protein
MAKIKLKCKEREIFDMYSNIIAGAVGGLAIGFWVYFYTINLGFLMSTIFALVSPALGWIAIARAMKNSKIKRETQRKEYLLNYTAGIIAGTYVLGIIANLGKESYIFKSLLAGTLFLFGSLIIIIIVARCNK